jgi:hypothetical protein
MAPAYVALGVERYEHLYLYPYGDGLDALAYGDPGGLDGELGIESSRMDELGLPSGEECEAWRALRERCEYPMEDAYLLALARRIHALSGVAVLVESIEMPME